MKRTKYVTDPIYEFGADKPERSAAELGFEKRRGVSEVEVRNGFTQVHISDLAGEVMDERIRVLNCVADAGISLDFLKLTPSGMSFIVPRNRDTALEQSLKGAEVEFSLRKDRAIVTVHAVNMRDEEGMIAGVVRRAIDFGAPIDHVTDMHDRMLLVMHEADAEQFAKTLRKESNRG